MTYLGIQDQEKRYLVLTFGRIEVAVPLNDVPGPHTPYPFWHGTVGLMQDMDAQQGCWLPGQVVRWETEQCGSWCRQCMQVMYGMLELHEARNGKARHDTAMPLW